MSFHLVSRPTRFAVRHRASVYRRSIAQSFDDPCLILSPLTACCSVQHEGAILNQQVDSKNRNYVALEQC
jgi:hypothetical protein